MYNTLLCVNRGRAVEFSQFELYRHPLVHKAFDLASLAYGDEKRPTSYTRKAISTLHHSVKVAELLQSTLADYDENIIAAAVTHDLEEDTDVDNTQLKNELGDDVASIVDEVSVDPNLKGQARREFQKANIESLSLSARRLKVADCTINLLNMAYDPPENWTISNKLNYLESRKELIKGSNLSDANLMAVAQEAVLIAERSVLVAVRERLRDKSRNAANWGKEIKQVGQPLIDMLDRAEIDIERMESAYDNEGLPVQNVETLNESYSEAPVAHREVSRVLKNMSDMYGFQAVIPEKLKERNRAEEVVEGRHNGSAKKITDVARGALVCKTMEDVHFAVHCLSHSYKNMVITDRFENPPMSAYRDLCVVVRTDNNYFAEIQIHLESFWNAKKHKGDDLYKEMRQLCESAEGGELTKEAKKSRRKLYEQSRKLYKAAGVEHGFESKKPEAALPKNCFEFLHDFKPPCLNLGTTQKLPEVIPA